MRGQQPLERIPARFGRRRTVFRRLESWRYDDLLVKLWTGYLHGLPPDERAEWLRRVAARPIDTFWRRVLNVVTWMNFPEAAA
jgi:hypothetical protein